MAFRRIVQSSENMFLFKTGPLFQKINCNVYLSSIVKKVDIPSPPKRPLTAYMLFCKEKRKDLLQDNPALTGPQQIKKLAEKWNLLSVDMKKSYEISARESTVLYGEAHKKFYENLSEDQKQEMARMKLEKKESRRLLKLKRTLKESGLPKPAVSAYALFVQSQAKGEGETKSGSNFMKEVAAKWNNLSEDTKKTFEEKAVADKKRFFSEMELWRKQLIREGKTDLLKEYDDVKRKGKVDTDDVIQKTLLLAKKKAVSGGTRVKTESRISKN